MLAIIELLAGIVCLFKKQINVNKSKVVSGAPIKILGVVLIVCSIGLHFIDIKNQLWLAYVFLGVPLVTLIAIMATCSKDVEAQ